MSIDHKPLTDADLEAIEFAGYDAVTTKGVERLVAEVRRLRAELDALKAPCQHRRYTESPNGRVRQCRDCFETLTRCDDPEFFEVRP